MGSNLLMNLWKNSFIYKVLKTIKKAFIESLNNSFIISMFLRDENIYGKPGLLIRVVEGIHKVILKLLRWVREILYNSISNSLLIGLAKSTKRTILSDIYRFMLITIGTSFVVFGILSFAKGLYTTKRTLFITAIGGLPLILGWVNVEMEKVFKDSRFVRMIKSIFDYNS